MPTLLLLTLSNLFMTTAWYWHLKGGMHKPLGLVILIDNSQPEAMSQLDDFLISLEASLRDVACVIGVGRAETHRVPSLDAFVARLAFHGFMFPVVEVDVRRRGDVLMLVELLLAQAEARFILERS